MTKLRNTNLDALTQCQYTRTISKKKNMEKHSKSLIFSKVFNCDMATRGTNNR